MVLARHAGLSDRPDATDPESKLIRPRQLYVGAPQRALVPSAAMS